MSSKKSSLLFVFEGGECCGKSTVVECLKQQLEAAGYPVITAREPGGSKNAERIRNTIMDCDGICAMAEALLFAASRAEFVQKTLLPSLESGKIVLLDRFYYSSLAYQGITKGLGFDTVYEMNRPFIEQVHTDMWFFLNVPPLVMRQRMNARNGKNRLDKFGLEQAEQINNAYLQVAEKFHGIVIDASQPVEHVVRDCLSHMQTLL